jgi:hypothetical protein
MTDVNQVGVTVPCCSALHYNSLVMRELPELFTALANSAFRQRFRLGRAELRCLSEKGLAVITGHARNFIQDRLSPAHPKNDGRQTPMRGHPVFIAQHATATCCRSCLAKWHGIAKGVRLSDEDVEYVIRVLIAWIEQQVDSKDGSSAKHMSRQQQLFD